MSSVAWQVLSAQAWLGYCFHDFIVRSVNIEGPAFKSVFSSQTYLHPPCCWSELHVCVGAGGWEGHRGHYCSQLGDLDKICCLNGKMLSPFFHQSPPVLEGLACYLLRKPSSSNNSIYLMPGSSSENMAKIYGKTNISVFPRPERGAWVERVTQRQTGGSRV
jgi:hypothetical protein